MLSDSGKYCRQVTMTTQYSTLIQHSPVVSTIVIIVLPIVPTLMLTSLGIKVSMSIIMTNVSVPSKTISSIIGILIVVLVFPAGNSAR